MDEIKKWVLGLGEFASWILAVLRHSGAAFVGAVLSAAISLEEHYRGEPISWDAMVVVIVLCIFWAFFAAWREESRLAKEYYVAIKELNVPCFGHSDVVRARLFDYDGQLGVLFHLRMINIGAPSKIGNWQVSGISHTDEVAAKVGPIPDNIRRSVLTNSFSINDLSAADSRAAIGGLHPLLPGVGRFRPSGGVLWALFPVLDIKPASIRVSFIDEVGKRYFIAPSPAVRQNMQDEKDSLEPFDKKLWSAKG
jgi:hypothetical protein